MQRGCFTKFTKHTVSVALAWEHLADVRKMYQVNLSYLCKRMSQDIGAAKVPGIGEYGEVNLKYLVSRVKSILLL